MKVNCNNVKHYVTDRIRNHKLNQWVRNTLLCVLSNISSCFSVYAKFMNLEGKAMVMVMVNVGVQKN
jgi:uncharacterized protein (DUF486 family)